MHNLRIAFAISCRVSCYAHICVKMHLTFACLPIFTLIGLVVAQKSQTDQHGSNSTSDRESRCPAKRCYRAAVYEHYRIDLSNTYDTAQVNLDIFDKVSAIASKNGADIIVFPEDGLFLDTIPKMNVVLSEVPNPKHLDTTNNNPCLHKSSYDSGSVLAKLSCMARRNNIYVVANFGTRESCWPALSDHKIKCPDRGYYVFNTNVVLNKKGDLVARYRKQHLFIEYFDESPYPEDIWFDTELGRFGTFTCFDILFRRPAAHLVDVNRVDTILFPTWWYDELPILSAIQVQQAWARQHKVNLLASNMLVPSRGSVGSGIYASGTEVYTAPGSKVPKLLLATINSNARDQGECSIESAPRIIALPEMINMGNYRSVANESFEYKWQNMRLLETDNVKPFDLGKQEIKACSGDVCCTIKYRLDPSTDARALAHIAIFVRDSLRQGKFPWYEQVCAILTFDQPFDATRKSDMTFALEAKVRFARIQLAVSNYTAQPFLMKSHIVSELIDTRSVSSNGDVSRSAYTIDWTPREPSESEQVYLFALYGRQFDADRMPSNRSGLQNKKTS